MKTLDLIPAVIFILAILCEVVDAEERQVYPSPDGRFTAEIVEVARSTRGTGESKVLLRSAKGKIMCSRSYASKDGEHGFGVEEAAWTPDSKFFVYSLLNSGGRQPWHAPIDFISVQDFKVRSLDGYTGPIMNPRFEISPPDVVHGIGQSRSKPGGESNFAVSLSAVVEVKKRASKEGAQIDRRKQ